MIKIGVIGSGYWGKHHLRLFSQLPCELVGIADIDPQKKELATTYGISYFSDYLKLLKKVDAVSIVTPPSTHYQITKKALKRSKHVLLEKPFVFTYREANELKNIADSKKLILMSGHTYLYSPAIHKLKEMITGNEIGQLYYLLFEWFNLGIIRKDVNALWNFAPHPYSILYYLLGKLPQKIQVTGSKFIQQEIEDIIFANLFYEKGLIAHVSLSWLHPNKIRKITLVGSKKMIIYDDTKLENQLEIFHKGISPEEFSLAQNWNDFAQFKSKIHYGDREITGLPAVEPLKEELNNFIQAIEGKKQVISGSESAVNVVKMLEISQKSLTKKGLKIPCPE